MSKMNWLLKKAEIISQFDKINRTDWYLLRADEALQIYTFDELIARGNKILQAIQPGNKQSGNRQSRIMNKSSSLLFPEFPKRDYVNIKARLERFGIKSLANIR